MTDPEELRSRAASIFERLRQSGAAQGPTTTPPPSDTPATSDQASGPPDAGGDGETAASQEPAAAAPLAPPVQPSDAEASPTEGGATPHQEQPAPTPISEQRAPLPASEEAEDQPLIEVDLAALEVEGSDAAPAVEVGSEVDPAGLAEADSSYAQPRPTHVAPVTGLPDDLPTLTDDSGDTGVPGWRGKRPLPRILAIANQKGGVGKTTTAVNLGAALAELGYRVLVIDLDPQGNATTGLGINARNLDGSVYDVLLHDVPIEDCIEPTSLRNLFVVPATIDLAGAEIELVPVFSRELRLKRAVQRVIDDFDFVVVDCPPSLGLLTVNGLAAATEVVVPIQCEYYALEGLGQLLRNVNLVQANLNPVLEVTTIILTMYDARTRLAEQVVAEVRAHFGDRVCRNVVPRTVRLSEAPSFGQPIIVFDSSSRGAIAYRELAKEVSGGAPQRIG